MEVVKNAQKSVVKKVKRPQVRQTLTSKLRLLKANPLLMYDICEKHNLNKDEIFFKPLKELAALLDDDCIQKTSILQMPKVTIKEECKETKVLLEDKIVEKDNKMVINDRNEKEFDSLKNSDDKSVSQTQEVIQTLDTFLDKEKSYKDYDDDEDKENICVMINNNNTTDLKSKSLALEALQDLHKLILDGYFPEQCETYLKRLKKRHKHLEEDPEYWECFAALEQQKGKLNSAVEYYKNAIIQGAEVEHIESSLNHLLEKFNLLNIQDDCANKDNKNVKDAKNIFKSSVIQFAVQERSVKKKKDESILIEKKFIATPVRRSTRLSRSAYTSTPGVQIYSSLKDIDSSVRKSLNFQCNKALKNL